MATAVLSIIAFLMLLSAGVRLYRWVRPPARPTGYHDHSSTGRSGHLQTPRRPSVDVEYADADGVVTERRITILQLSIDPDTGKPLRLHAWCHLRQAERSFRPDRILRMRNADTGETVANIDNQLRQWTGRIT